MAFKFDWPTLPAQTLTTATTLLTRALSRTPTPPIITDAIVVKELYLGSQPPELEMLEIGELGEDRFRGVFKCKYGGDAYIVLQTKVQANPLHTRSKTTPSFTDAGILYADTPLVVPMHLRLSHFHLSAISILVFSLNKGLTLVFRNDPLESVHVSSTFDSIPSVQGFLQKEIERLLRGFLMDEGPGIIWRLSLEWIGRRAGEQCLSPSVINNSATGTTDGKDGKNAGVVYFRDLDGENGHLASETSDNPHLQDFSPANLLRLQGLASSQRTLSPFTPSISQSVFRSSTTLIASLKNSVPSKRYPVRRERKLSFGPSVSEGSSISSSHSTSSDLVSDRSKIRSLSRPGLSTAPPPYSSHPSTPSLADSMSITRSVFPNIRSSFLRRSGPPKRKIIKLNSGDQSRQGSGAVTPATAESEIGKSRGGEEQYFGEPISTGPWDCDGVDETHTWGNSSMMDRKPADPRFNPEVEGLEGLKKRISAMGFGKFGKRSVSRLVGVQEDSGKEKLNVW